MKAMLEAPYTGARTDIASFVASERYSPRFSWYWHYHPEIELTWIRKGEGTRLVGDHSEKYRPGDFVLLGSNLPHSFPADAPRKPGPRANQAFVIQFHPRLLPDGMLAVPDLSAVAQMMALARFGLHFSPATADALSPLLLALPAKKGTEAWLALIEILARLSARTDFKVLASEHYRSQRNFQVNSRLERVLAFMDKNCGHDLDLATVARVAHLSPVAFSRFFHKMMGKTFVAHRTSCRVGEACRLLIQTDQSVTDIAYRSGFGNLANFNRQFLKEKQLSPLKYRRLHNPH
jgi:AraC-like DNA-binding protein